MSKDVNWQEECLKKGFEYVSEPDDHYVIAAPAEMVALLRDLLGVDVRTKDGDSYGVAVCELQEQVDGLVSTLHAQQAERDALLAERDRMAEALGSMTCAYRMAIQSGHARITALGGECDSVERMIADFPDYGKAVELYKSHRAALQGEQP